MRDFLTGIAALLAIALIALMVGPYFVDWNAQRERAAAWLSEQMGVEIRLNGEFRPAFLPVPAFDAEEVEIGPDQNPYFRARRLTFTLSAAALLAGKLQVSAIRADDAQIRRDLVRLPQEGALEALPDLMRRIAIEQGEISGLALVDSISANLPAGVARYDVSFAAPGIAGPYKIDVLDRAQGREYHAQIGKFEAARARLKGVVEDKHIGARISLDGLFALPGVPGRAIFDGAVIANGNPLLGGEAGRQVPFQLAARVIAQGDQIVVDPANLTLGTGAGAAQLAGRALVDLLPERPLLDLRLSAKRADIAPFFAEEREMLASLKVVSAMLAPGALSGTPFDARLEVGIAAAQLAGGQAQEVQIRAGLDDGHLTLQNIGFGLPGNARIAYRRDEAGNAAVGGVLDIAIGDLPSFMAWLHGPDLAAHLPASARFGAKLSGDLAAIAIGDMAFETPVGVVRGQGEFLLPRAGGRGAPRLSLKVLSEKFDARVLSALDPSPLAARLELAADLDIRGLSLDGQDLGSLLLSLERDQAGARIRQMRLRGKRGEELTLSGTMGTGLVQLAGKLDAERLGDLARLARALYPGALTEAFAARAATLEPALAVARMRITNEGGRAVWDIDAEGRLGGTKLAGRSVSTLAGGNWHASLEADLSNPDGGRLAAQLLGLPLQAGSSAGQVTIKAQGDPRREVRGHAEGEFGGMTFRFDGGFGAFRSNPLDGRLTLKATDLPGFGRLFVQETSVRNAAAEVAGRLYSDQAKLTLTGMEARIGGQPVSGEISFDLARGGQVAGQLRTGALSLPALLAPALGDGALDGEGGWSRASFPPAFAMPLAGDLWIEATEMRFANRFHLRQPRFVWRFAPGATAFEGLESAVGEGRLGGALALMRRGSKLEIAGRIDAARLPLGLGSARISGDIPFAGGGSTPFELVSSLSGAGTVMLDGFVVPEADPLALARVTAMPLEALQPLDENHVGGIVDRALRQGELRLPATNWPASLSGGLIRFGGTPMAPSSGISVTPAFTLDLPRREMETRLVMTSTQIPRDWRGALPEISLTQLMRLGMPGTRRNLQVSSLVNGFLAVAIQRDLERTEAFDADMREREMQLRRQRADAFMERRDREIRAFEAMVESEKRRQEEARRAEEKRKAEEGRLPLPGAPLDIAPRPALPPG